MENKTAAREDRCKLLQLFRAARESGNPQELSDTRAMYQTWRAAYPESAAEEDRAREEIAAIKSNRKLARAAQPAPAPVVAPVPDHCQRCGHTWYRRGPERPSQCPRCKQPRWDTPARPRAVKPVEDEDESILDLVRQHFAHDEDLPAKLDRMRASLETRRLRRAGLIPPEPIPTESIPDPPVS